MEKNNTIDTITGIGAGYAVYKYAPQPLFSLRRVLLKNNLDKPLTDTQVAEFKKITMDLFESKFKPQGASIVDVSTVEGAKYIKDRTDELVKSFDDSIKDSKNFVQRAIKKYWKDYFVRDSASTNYATIQGTNAYFERSKKTFVVNMDKKPVYLFHEMGHFLDYLDPKVVMAMKVWKNPIFQKSYLTAILATALFTNKKSKEEVDETKNIFVKSAHFTKKHCGVLAAALLLPAALEECMANVQGQKLAKEVVPKKLMSIVTKSHINSATGYLLGAVFTGVAMYLANYVRDKIVHRS